MRNRLTLTEAALMVAVLALLALALGVPAMPQPAGHHDFADQRVLWGLPYAMDVLSNLPFAVAGLVGAWLLRRAHRGALTSMQEAMAALFFAGLLVTACGSSWYHLQPSDAGLAIDRYAMSIAFAGLVGLGAASRVSERAGAALGLAVLAFAPLAVFAWASTGNIVPWVAVQFGGMALIVMFAAMPARHEALKVNWWLVIGAYAVAKLFELGDHAVYEATAGWLSGHSLKHIVAALAALPVLAALRQGAPGRQNAAHTRRIPA